MGGLKPRRSRQEGNGPALPARTPYAPQGTLRADMRLSRRSVTLLVPAASALGRLVGRVIAWGPLRVQSSRSGEELCVYVRRYRSKCRSHGRVVESNASHDDQCYQHMMTRLVAWVHTCMSCVEQARFQPSRGPKARLSTLDACRDRGRVRWRCITLTTQNPSARSS